MSHDYFREPHLQLLFTLPRSLEIVARDRRDPNLMRPHVLQKRGLLFHSRLAPALMSSWVCSCVSHCHKGPFEPPGLHPPTAQSHLSHLTPTDVSSWIVYPSGKVHVAAVLLERVVLTCELCRPWAEVRWTKDGEEIVDSPGRLVQKEDTVRRLVLPAVQLEDSGEYLCEIDNEAASFTITVTGAAWLPLGPTGGSGVCVHGAARGRAPIWKNPGLTAP